MSLSVVIITQDEQEDLPRCLESVRGLAEQVVVVDSGSTDGTLKLAREAGAQVVEQPWLGHVAQKQVALDLAEHEWVLSLDADEWLDDALRGAVEEIIAGASEGDECLGYELNRRSRYLGKWIDHCGWSPEWRLRLVRRGRARIVGRDPHDSMEVDGQVGRLLGRLNHQPYRDLAEHFSKINQYTSMSAKLKAEAGERASMTRLILRPPARFLRMFVQRAGFLDGWRGFVVSSIGAFYVFLKYAKLLELQRARDE